MGRARCLPFILALPAPLRTRAKRGAGDRLESHEAKALQPAGIETSGSETAVPVRHMQTAVFGGPLGFGPYYSTISWRQQRSFKRQGTVSRVSHASLGNAGGALTCRTRVEMKLAAGPSLW